MPVILPEGCSAPLRCVVRLLCIVSLVLVAVERTTAAPELTSAVAKDYVLEAGDVISVKVFQEPDLERELRVSREGDLYFPLIGKIEATGRTLAEIERTVRDAYDKDYLVNPQINIIVQKYQVRTVNVLGAVNGPQAVEYPPEQRLTLLDAISRAGGFSRLADRRHVRLTRTLHDGRVENTVVNADELMSGAAKDPLVLKKDDVIYVPERVL